jgi:hypothetical protein
MRGLVVGLARRGKSAIKVKITVDAAYGDKAFGLTSMYYIIKKVKAGKSTDDQQNLNAKKTTWTADIIAFVTVDVEEDQCVTCRGSRLCPWGLQWHHAQHPSILQEELGFG